MQSPGIRQAFGGLKKLIKILGLRLGVDSNGGHPWPIYPLATHDGRNIVYTLTLTTQCKGAFHIPDSSTLGGGGRGEITNNLEIP